MLEGILSLCHICVRATVIDRSYGMNHQTAMTTPKHQSVFQQRPLQKINFIADSLHVQWPCGLLNKSGLDEDYCERFI